MIVEGRGQKEHLTERINEIKSQLEATTSGYDKDKLKERLGKLTGGIAVLKVGGASDTEVNELKDRIEDALCATRAAAEEGIVPGGGSALLYASRLLKELKTENFDQQNGVNIIIEALKSPVIAICNNAGLPGVLIANQLLEQKNEKLGINAQSGEKVDMIKSGIIDPTKVVRTAIVGAARVASLMLTTEAMVVDEPKKDEKSGKQNGMGMGSMDDDEY